jgi:glycine/D-amino acid oxidase-like deaminating enzyme
MAMVTPAARVVRALHGAEEFDPAVEAAQALLRPEARFTPEHRVNGVFARTPDNLPFLGRHPGMDGVWIAQALWVTPRRRRDRKARRCTRRRRRAAR